MTDEPGVPAPSSPSAPAAEPPQKAGRYDGSRPDRHRTGPAALALGALGVVFGDIGTSPLYSVQTVFTADNHRVQTHPVEVYGVISLVFWAITVIVSVKYVTFILRADNDGEGGIMALTALLQNHSFKTRRGKAVLIALGIFGASLFYGDGIITPAISVLSAVEGVKVATPALSHLVVPITLTVLTVLFVIQRYGTGLVGKLFGPVMALWFTVLAAAGINGISKNPAILRALSPTYAVAFIAEHGMVAFVALGAVVLAVTGAEALYADMGHFGRPPITRAWFLVVFPALTLNYLGQGAVILRTPSAAENPFFLIVPGWARIPMVLLATVATIIASQSVISGAFSVTRQAVQLGFLPRMTIRHTSEREVGQVYSPAINWILYVAVVALVLGFESSAGLASAYGVAVTGTFVLNSVLFLAVARSLWEKPRWLVALGGTVFLTVEVAFFLANLTKITHGGWLPLLVAGAVFTVLLTWRRGRIIVTRNRTREEGPLLEFVERLRTLEPPVHRVPGTAVFLNANPDTTPLALRANVEHNHVLQQRVIIMHIQVRNVPHVPVGDRLTSSNLGFDDDGISGLDASFGFQDEPNVPAALHLAVKTGHLTAQDLEEVTYFLSRITLVQSKQRNMAAWRKKLFLTISHNSAHPVTYFGLPISRSISMGEQIPL
ncbi:potassium transporter Kup [Streptomyces sp. SID1034]|uniref:potassium transporter Kup n=1 Tax=Streptomyces sp. SID1034 TaxID=2690248 RepID=UPI0019277CE4|nr:potassium transporter Kup [Streptomyces sp. SID1034]